MFINTVFKLMVFLKVRGISLAPTVGAGEPRATGEELCLSANQQEIMFEKNMKCNDIQKTS
jgi:hypothetical protein